MNLNLNRRNAIALIIILALAGVALLTGCLAQGDMGDAAPVVPDCVCPAPVINITVNCGNGEAEVIRYDCDPCPECPVCEDCPECPVCPECPECPPCPERQHCNQGVGNGPEGCSPGNSDHNQPPNDEGQGDGPGNPRRGRGRNK